MQHLGAKVFVISYLLIQIGVPVRGLLDPGATRFSWKMFASRHRGYSTYSVIENGRVRTLGNPAQTGKAAMMRPEIEFDRYLPPHLCREMPTIEAVIVKPAGRTQQVIPCK